MNRNSTLQTGNSSQKSVTEFVGELRLEIVVHEPLDAAKDVPRQPVDKPENGALPVRRQARALRSSAWSAGVHGTPPARPNVHESYEASTQLWRRSEENNGGRDRISGPSRSEVCITPKLAPMIQLCACSFGWPNDFYNYHIIKAGNAAMLDQHKRKRFSGQLAK
ncbi:hypothetical protein ABZP36_019483 [Zizania latifolia]